MSDDSSTGSSDTDKLEEGGSSSLPECIQESDLEAISVSISQKGISIDELGQKLKIQAEDIEKVKDESEIRGQVLKLLHVWKNQGDTSSVTLDHLVNATGIKLQEVQSHLSARPDLEVCRPAGTSESESEPVQKEGEPVPFPTASPPYEQTVVSVESSTEDTIHSDIHSQQESSDDPTCVLVSGSPPSQLALTKFAGNRPTRRKLLVRQLNPEVRRNVGVLEEEFASLKTTVIGALAERKVSVAIFRTYVSSLANAQKDNILHSEVCMIQLRELDKVDKMSSLFDQYKVWDFLNFRLLQQIAQKFLADDTHLQLQANIDEYSKKVEDFQKKTKLSDFLDVSSSKGVTYLPMEDRVILQANLTGHFSECTLHDLAETQGYIAGEFLLQDFMFKFLHARPGSVIVYWVVSEEAAQHIKDVFKRRKPNLSDGGIMEFFVGEELLYQALDISNYEELYRKSITSPKEFWGDMAKRMLVWEEPFNKAKVMDECNLEEGKIRWFDGKINASVNCLDRHVAAHPDRVAIIWEKDEPGKEERVTYKELLEMTCRIANVLKDYNVVQGECVIIYMPTMPLAVASMLACARIGAVHSVIFTALNAKDVKIRIKNAKARVILTADGYVRGGEKGSLKTNVEQALEAILKEREQAEKRTKLKNVQDHTKSQPFVVFIANRMGPEVSITEIAGVQEKFLEEEMENREPFCDPVPMDSESPLFIVYTSGTTGQLTGIEHSTAGYLLHVALSHKYVFDCQPGDVFGCVAVLGWITGHSHVVYGPLCNGGTTVLFESIATYPNHGRYWEMIERLGITQFYTTPSSIRCLMKGPAECIDRFKGKLKSLKLIATVGEPLNKDARDWFLDKVGQGDCPLIDTWWQTETGGICIVMDHQLPDKYPKAKFPPRPFFGVEPFLADESCEELVEKEGSHGKDPGYLYLKQVLPGMGRRFIKRKPTKQLPGKKVVTNNLKEIYFSRENKFFTYDWVYKVGDNGYRVLGRMDDAIRVKGVWLDIPEIERAMNRCDKHIEDTSIVGLESLVDECDDDDDDETDCSHDYGGTCAFVELRSGQDDKKDPDFQEKLVDNLKSAVTTVAKDKKYPPEAVPRMFIIIGQQLLTHSGKIARTFLRRIITLTKDISKVCALKKTPGAVAENIFQNLNVDIIYLGDSWPHRDQLACT